MLHLKLKFQKKKNLFYTEKNEKKIKSDLIITLAKRRLWKSSRIEEQVLTRRRRKRG